MAELKPLICKSSGCHYFDGFGCTRSDVVGDNDEKTPCDKGERKLKVGDKVWIPVTVAETDNDGTTNVKYGIGVTDFWVDNTEIQTVTAEDYRNALSEFYKMGSMERVKIWGFGFVGSALDTSAEEFVGRLRKHRNEPKTGQIWKNTRNQKVVVLKADEHEVRYYRPCGNTSGVSRNCFDDNFRNTGEVLISVATFLKDLEGLNEG